MTTKHVYTTVNGLDVPIQAISLVEYRMAQAALRKEYLERGEPVDPPTYKVALGQDGQAGEQEFPHDETTLKTDEDRAAWARHVEAQRRLSVEEARLLSEMVYEDGILINLPADNAWEEKQRRRRIQAPDDPRLKRFHYLDTVVFTTQEDIKGAVAKVLALSARGTVQQEEVEAVLDSFQHPVPAGRKQAGPAILGAEAQA